MSVDAYSSCTCGSGKKFKWCCQPYAAQFERAAEMQRNGQTEAALEMLKELTQTHVQTAEVWGRYAEQLWYCGRHEDAQEALKHALQLNEQLPLGYFLRGMFAHEGGDYRAALRDYRKAIELCHPDAKQLLIEVYLSTAQCELLLNHFMAARAAFEIVLRIEPGQAAAGKLMAELFGVESQLPEVIRKSYALKPLPHVPDADLQKRREQSLETCRTGKLSDALLAYEEMAHDTPEDPAVLYNLALIHSWLGDQLGAMTALERYVACEPEETQAVAAAEWAVALTFCDECMDRCDFVHHYIRYEVLDAEVFKDRLTSTHRLIEPRQKDAVLYAKWMDREIPPAHENMALFELPRVAAHVIIDRYGMNIDGGDEELLNKAKDQIEAHFGPCIQANVDKGQVIPNFVSVVLDRFNIRLPEGLPPEVSKRLIDTHLSQEFEDRWLNQPSRFLHGRTPKDAMAMTRLRPLALGAFQFLRNLCTGKLPIDFDFERIRQLLLEVPLDPALIAPILPELTFRSFQPMAPIAEQTPEELAKLKWERLSREDLLLAMQTAVRQQALAVAARFAKPLLAKSTGDPFAMYQILIQAALAEKQADQAQQWLDEGIKVDAERHGGARKLDYEMLRARLFISGQQPMKAYESFVKLLHAHPGNMDLLGNASETLLKAGLRPQALQFAEHGLAQARAKGDRDRLSYFQELMAVAKRG